MDKKKNPLSNIRISRIIYPIILGLGIVLFMFIRSFNPEIFQNIHFSLKSVLFFFVAICLMLFRDIGYIIRLRILSDQSFSWLQSFRIVMLWEFTSAITPSAIGGTSVAILYLNKEGMSLGRSSAVVMATSFLDELYFILTFPLVLLLLKGDKLFSIMDHQTGISSFGSEFFYFAIVGYSIKLLFTLFLSYGLFLNPRGLKWLILWIFRMPILKRWRLGASEAGSDLIRSSIELRKKSFTFWLKAFIATAFSWTSRYWIVNALFLAFFTVPDHLILYARQLVIWIMMLVSPTPGGSGFSEFVFIRYFGEFIQTAPEFKESFAVVLAFIWRAISYYPYLIIGAIIFPRWIRLKFGSASNISKEV